ncbi:MAG: hypothetical protein ABFC34_06620 [Methanobacterium sp.]
MENAFVIMQIGNKELDKIFEEVISPALHSFDHEAIRVDKHTEGELVKGEIKDFIDSASIIVADLTNERPNCYLEVGYTMGVGKNKNLILTARDDHNPNNPRYVPGGPKIHFDLIGYDILFWDPEDLEGFKTKLEARIQRRLRLQRTKNPKNVPQIYMSFNNSEEPCKSSGEIYPTHRIYYRNGGDKTASRVESFILVGSDNKIETMNGGGGMSESIERFKDQPDFADFIDKYSNIQIFHFIYPRRGETKIYPGNKVSDGYIAIREKDLDKIHEIIVLNYEDNGVVKQEFKLSDDGDQNLVEIDSSFNQF